MRRQHRELLSFRGPARLSSPLSARAPAPAVCGLQRRGCAAPGSPPARRWGRAGDRAGLTHATSASWESVGAARLRCATRRDRASPLVAAPAPEPRRVEPVLLRGGPGLTSPVLESKKETTLSAPHRSSRSRRPGTPAPFLPFASACLLALAFTPAPGLAGPPVPGGGGTTNPSPPMPLVGVFELASPGDEPFLLHGTLPIRPGFYPRPDGSSPFMVRTPDDTVVPAQTEAVSFYPVEAHGADVVEIMARVPGHAGGSPGERLRYEVLFAPHTPTTLPAAPGAMDLVTGPVAVPPQVAGLLQTGGVFLYAEDVFGNPYLLNLTQGAAPPVLQRYGFASAELRTYGSLKPLLPTGGVEGTLPHLFGVHAYLRTFTEDAVLGLDLRIHNGHDGHDPVKASDDALGDVYFRRIDVVAPNGWIVQTAFQDTQFTPSLVQGNYVFWSIVPPRADGKPHVMPWRGQFLRRLALSPPQHQGRARHLLDQRGLAFAHPMAPQPGGTDPWSWWNPTTARYYPQRQPLPRLPHLDPQAVRDTLSLEFGALEQVLATGSPSPGFFPVPSGALGWAHPYGNSYGGVTSGDGIGFYDGVDVLVSGSNEGYRRFQLVHRMQTDRQPTALYHLTGRPTTLFDWLEGGPGSEHLSFMFYMGPLGSADPFGAKSSPSFQRDYVQANGLQPDYQWALLGYDPHDLEHLVRYTSSAKALVWIGNDSLAKDDLLMQAELCRFTYNPYPSSADGHIASGSMLADLDDVSKHPGHGFVFGRAEGWVLDTMNAVYSTRGKKWRQKALPFYAQLVPMLQQGQIACTGFLQAQLSPKLVEGKYRARQSIEHNISDNGLRGALESVYRGAAPPLEAQLEGILEDSAKALIGPLSWSDGLYGPYTESAVAPPNPADPPFCSSLPSDGFFPLVDDHNPWATLAHGYEVTGDMTFLDRADELISKGPDGTSLASHLKADGLANLINRAPMLRLIEDLGLQ